MSELPHGQDNEERNQDMRLEQGKTQTNACSIIAFIAPIPGKDDKSREEHNVHLPPYEMAKGRGE
jgi:hypothetical protein